MLTWCAVCSLPLIAGCPETVTMDPCDGVTCDAGETCVNGQCAADDACADVTCDAGQSCVDGTCVADDACPDVPCDAGQSCVDGTCVADDACADVTCNDGETCVDGTCVADDPCADVTCNDGESCVDGTCVADAPDAGPDATAGETFFADNGCAACHGDDGSGPPSLIDVSAALISDKLDGTEEHTGDTLELTEEDEANLEAFLAAP